MNTTTIGFIGTGVMGTGMIRNLLKAGFPVNIYTRTKSKADASFRKDASGLNHRRPSPQRRTSSFPSSAIRKTSKKFI